MDSSVPDRARVLAVKPPTAEDVVSAISKRAFPISPGDIVRRIPQDCEWVLLGEARLLGEASHGTKQFYQVRCFVLPARSYHYNCSEQTAGQSQCRSGLTSPKSSSLKEVSTLFALKQASFALLQQTLHCPHPAEENKCLHL